MFREKSRLLQDPILLFITQPTDSTPSKGSEFHEARHHILTSFKHPRPRHSSSPPPIRRSEKHLVSPGEVPEVPVNELPSGFSFRDVYQVLAENHILASTSEHATEMSRRVERIIQKKLTPSRAKSKSEVLTISPSNNPPSLHLVCRLLCL